MIKTGTLFDMKRSKTGAVERRRARLVAQGFFSHLVSISLIHSV